MQLIPLLYLQGQEEKIEEESKVEEVAAVVEEKKEELEKLAVESPASSQEEIGDLVKVEGRSEESEEAKAPEEVPEKKEEVKESVSEQPEAQPEQPKPGAYLNLFLKK